MKTIIRINVVVGLLFVPALLWSQSQESPFDGYTPGAAMPGSPAGSYALSGFESLNLANGLININLPLISAHGRGTVTVPLTAPLSNAFWDATAYQYMYNCNQSGCQSGYGYVVHTAGWNPLAYRFGTGRMLFRSAGDYCMGSAPNQHWNTVLTRATFVSPDGTETEFIDQQTGGNPAAGNLGYNRGTAFTSDNGTLAKFTSSSAITDPTYCGSAVSDASGTLVLRDGTSYTIGGGYVTSIKDHDGNITSLSGGGVTDSSGRTYSFLSTGIQYAGAGGAQRTITIRYSALDAVLASGELIQTFRQLWSLPYSSGPGSGNLDQSYDPNDRISEIDLPNGSKYSFTYHSYGDVAQITLPTGGVIQYDYGTSVTSAAASPATAYLLTRPLTERREFLRGALVSRIDNVYGGEIDRFDGAGNLLAKETHTIVNGGTPPTSGTNYNSWQYNQQSQANYYDVGGSTLLKTQTTAWVQGPCQVNCSTVQTVTTTMNGKVSQSSYTYDSNNNLTDTIENDWGSGGPGGALRRTHTSYTGPIGNVLALPQETKVYDGAGNLYSDAQNTYDGSGNLTISGRCSSLGSSCGNWVNTTFGYDGYGNVISAKDANGNTTSLTYDGGTHSFVVSSVNALNQGPSSPAAYDTNLGQPTDTYDLNGNHTHFDYGSSGYGVDQIIHIGLPNGGNTYYNYLSPLTVMVQSDQNTANDRALETQTTTDGFGRVIEADTFESASQYIAATTTYDALGRVIAATNPSRYTNGQGDGLGYTTTYAYDGLGRTVAVTTPDNAVARTSYSGNATTVTDQAGHKRTATSDGLGRLTTVVEDPDGLNYTTNYTYDPLGNLRTVSQNQTCAANPPTPPARPSQGCRYFGYDPLARLVWSVQPEAGTFNYSYDNNGNVTWPQTNYAIQTSYTYDALNRLKTVSYSNGTPGVTYSYDPSVANGIGQLGGVSNSTAAVSYSNFDSLGHVTSSSQQVTGQTYSFAYNYNLAGGLVSETYPSGRVITTNYDTANRVSQVAGHLNGAQTNYITQTSYWPHGAPSSIGFGNTVARGTSFNSRLQPSQLWDTLNSDASKYIFVENSLNWGSTNNNGNLYGVTLYAGGPAALGNLQQFAESFSYDNVNRLSTASDSGGWSRSFGYDAYSNMWVTGASGGPWSGTTPITGSAFNSYNQIAASSYDTAGNQTSLNGNTVVYDAENRVATVTSPPSLGGTETISYDGLGERVQKVMPGSTTVYVYDAFGQVAAEYSTASQTSPCSTCYLSSDHLGSPRLVTDQYGNVVARHDFLPFGEEIAANSVGRNGQWGSTTDVEQKFTGQIRDQESGLDYFNARYFGAALGRFTSPDPGNAGTRSTDPQTWNAYAYVNNTPLDAVDPTGLKLVDCVWDGCSGLHNGGGGGGSVVVDGVPQTIFSTSGLGSNALAACPNNNCTGISADAADNVFSNKYSAQLELNCAGESTDNYQCSWSHWSRWLVQNGNQTAYFGNVQQLFNGNQQLWKNTAGAGNALAAATAVVVAAPIAIDALGALSSMQVGVGASGFGTPFHVVYGTAGQFQQGLLVGGQMIVTGGAFAARTFTNSPIQFSLPVLNQSAILAQEAAAVTNCVTAGICAFGRGWVW